MSKKDNSMTTSADVVIVGAGPAGLFSALTLAINNTNMNIVIIDKGKSIEDRKCPMREKPGTKCKHCKTCAIMSGFGGAGTFSDCKLSLTPHGVGGNIVDYVGSELAEKLIESVETTYRSFDCDRQKRVVFGETSDETLKYHCDLYGIDYILCPTKHLGTDGTYKVMQNMQAMLSKEKNITFLFDTVVTGIDYEGTTPNSNTHFVYTINNVNKVKTVIKTKNVILAPGRSGNKWLKSVAENLNIETSNNKVDIGVRVEMPAKYIKPITDATYDMKLSCTDEKTGNKVRTFCTNPNGYVSEEHYDGDLAVVNGHSFADKKSDNTNFALLVTLNDVSLDSDYTRSIVKLANKVSQGNIIKQNFIEFLQGYQYLTEDTKGSIKPTLNTAINGNLTNILPSSVASLICEFIVKFTNLFTQLSNIEGSYHDIYSNIILYGIEAKFYGDLIKVDSNMQTSCKGIYAIGDGAGITRGITQAAACGIVAATDIISKYYDENMIKWSC